jgi:hypothetical protein
MKVSLTIRPYARGQVVLKSDPNGDSFFVLNKTEKAGSMALPFIFL